MRGPPAMARLSNPLMARAWWRPDCSKRSWVLSELAEPRRGRMRKTMTRAMRYDHSLHFDGTMSSPTLAPWKVSVPLQHIRKMQRTREAVLVNESTYKSTCTDLSTTPVCFDGVSDVSSARRGLKKLPCAWNNVFVPRLSPWVDWEAPHRRAPQCHQEVVSMVSTRLSLFKLHFLLCQISFLLCLKSEVAAFQASLFTTYNVRPYELKDSNIYWFVYVCVYVCCMYITITVIVIISISVVFTITVTIIITILSLSLSLSLSISLSWVYVYKLYVCHYHCHCYYYYYLLTVTITVNVTTYITVTCV